MSDSDFDDDDDEAVLQLMRSTQKSAFSGQFKLCAAPTPVLSDLFRAQGEIAILRAQLESLQKLKAEETSKLTGELASTRDTAKDQIEALKTSVDKLEDEKRFLRNEVKSLSAAKKRKVSSVDSASSEKSFSVQLTPVATVNPSKSISEAPFLIQDDWLQLCDYLWHYTIPGSDRTLIVILLRISVVRNLDISPTFRICSDAPLLSQIWDYLIQLRLLRLDCAVTKFCELVLAFIVALLAEYRGGHPTSLLAVPFLFSLLYAALTFKPLAVTDTLAILLIAKVTRIVARFTFVLQLNDEEEEALMGHENVTHQQRILENFTLIVGLDLVEQMMAISTQFGPDFVRRLWIQNIFDTDLLNAIVPETTERFVATGQINVVFNAVETLFASLTEDGFATGIPEKCLNLIRSLIKAFLMDIDIKEDFCFYGLNRLLGNNHDFSVLSAVVPEKLPSFLGVSFLAVPCPINSIKLSEKARAELLLLHDSHLLNLRVRIAALLESVVVSGMSSLINLRENIKLVVRVMSFEQNLIMHQPRYKYIYLRLQLVGTLVRTLYYIIEEHKSINTLIYPETLYEILVVLMRIAFGSDSLSVDAHKVISEVRHRGELDLAVFHRECEQRSRELAHLNLYDRKIIASGQLADVEGDYANGLEFPYDSETIEIAREILGICLNHDEADNLYFNITRQVSV